MNATWLIAAIAALAAALIGYLLGTLRASRRTQKLSGELEAARAKLTSETELRERNAELLAQSEAQVRAAVESASRLALDANSETFLKLAREVFGSDQAKATATLKEREEAIKQLVEPLKVALARQEEQSKALSREQQESAGRITGQIENLVKVQALLQRETRNLSTALRRPEVRGRWGEITLRRVVELAGMSEHCDFTEQTQVERSETRCVASRSAGAHARCAQHRGRCQDAARRLHGRRGGRRTTKRAASRSPATHSRWSSACASSARKVTGSSSSTARNSRCCSCREISSCRRRWPSAPI